MRKISKFAKPSVLKRFTSTPQLFSSVPEWNNLKENLFNALVCYAIHSEL
jgi:hypothetical protein